MSQPSLEEALPAGHARIWHCGTLRYTKASLVSLFVFLLWGNFAFTVMMSVIPSILPIKLKSLGASDWLIGLLLTSVFPMFGMFISPYLSFKSDYLRTRWGRRMPFFFFSLPLVTVTIVLLAYSQDIASFFHRTGLLARWTPEAAAIGVMGVCIVAFQFADVVVASVYNYIFNDTVPVPLIGRFNGLIQVVGGSVGFLYNFFIFKYAESHMKEIFLGTAGLYFVAIGLMCIFVKEGEYPPVTDEERRNTRGMAGFKTFFRESFSHKFYWTKFLYAMSPALGAALWPFNLFFHREMGLSLDYIGKAAAITSVGGILAAYFASVFVDRWHPLRIMAYSGVFAATLSLSGWVWLFVTLPPEAFFWIQMLGVGLLGIFHGALLRDASMPFDIRLLPKSRYGQFCSAQSILANVCKMVAGVAAGLFFMFLKEKFFRGSDFAYRFNFVWAAAANILMAFVICSLYRQWKALGGDLHFHPPAPWSESGFEEVEQAPFVGTQSRWLGRALRMINALYFLTIIFLAAVTWMMWHIGWVFEFRLYLVGIVPLSIILYAVWVKVENDIMADVARCAAGETPGDGIPHHGVLYVKALVMLLGFPATVAMTVVAIYSGLPVGVTVFGVAGQFSALMVILTVLILRRLERGYDPMLNYDGRKSI